MRLGELAAKTQKTTRYWRPPFRPSARERLSVPRLRRRTRSGCGIVKYRVISWVVRGVVFGSHAHGAAGKTHAMLLTAVKLRQLCSRRVFMSAVLAAACPRRCLRPRE